jgi:hypothetical protein
MRGRWPVASIAAFLLIRLGAFFLQRAARLWPALRKNLFRFFAESALLMGLLWLAQEGAIPGRTPSGTYLLTRAGASCLMSAAMAVVAPPPLPDVVALRAIAVLVVFSFARATHDPVTYIILELPAAMTYFATRAWLETVMLKSFLRHMSTSKFQ